ncbi:hypothetical protein CBR_g21774 [Chara braunii]|uniref:Protein transport protein sec16 n=1 Tax=Chara braunii TaxID=69332 RepID=A0A388JUE0_CHABU|nr:hypothetical protein CBR_g21774 [Chara braunii]|eukprot:GBG61429.1 hypothetical protein CBR_g21774 [Chara braunii]
MESGGAWRPLEEIGGEAGAFQDGSNSAERCVGSMGSARGRNHMPAELGTRAMADGQLGAAGWGAAARPEKVVGYPAQPATRGGGEANGKEVSATSNAVSCSPSLSSSTSPQHVAAADTRSSSGARLLPSLSFAFDDDAGDDEGDAAQFYEEAAAFEGRGEKGEDGNSGSVLRGDMKSNCPIITCGLVEEVGGKVGDGGDIGANSDGGGMGHLFGGVGCEPYVYEVDFSNSIALVEGKAGKNSFLQDDNPVSAAADTPLLRSAEARDVDVKKDTGGMELKESKEPTRKEGDEVCSPAAMENAAGWGGMEGDTAGTGGRGGDQDERERRQEQAGGGQRVSATQGMALAQAERTYSVSPIPFGGSTADFFAGGEEDADFFTQIAATAEEEDHHHSMMTATCAAPTEADGGALGWAYDGGFHAGGDQLTETGDDLTGGGITTGSPPNGYMQNACYLGGAGGPGQAFEYGWGGGGQGTEFGGDGYGGGAGHAAGLESVIQSAPGMADSGDFGIGASAEAPSAEMVESSLSGGAGNQTTGGQTWYGGEGYTSGGYWQRQQANECGGTEEGFQGGYGLMTQGDVVVEAGQQQQWYGLGGMEGRVGAGGNDSSTMDVQGESLHYTSEEYPGWRWNLVTQQWEVDPNTAAWPEHQEAAYVAQGGQDEGIVRSGEAGTQMQHADGGAMGVYKEYFPEKQPGGSQMMGGNEWYVDPQQQQQQFVGVSGGGKGFSGGGGEGDEISDKREGTAKRMGASSSSAEGSEYWGKGLGASASVALPGGGGGRMEEEKGRRASTSFGQSGWGGDSNQVPPVDHYASSGQYSDGGVISSTWNQDEASLRKADVMDGPSFSPQHQPQYQQPPPQQHQPMRYMPKHFALEKQLWADTPPKTNDEAMRSTAGRPSHALVVFGFGGRMVVAKPLVSMHLRTSTGNESGGTISAHGPISIYSLNQVVCSSGEDGDSMGGNGRLHFAWLSGNALAGPLVGGGNVSQKDLLKWIDERASKCHVEEPECRNPESLRMLWGLLKVACQHYGRLRSVGVTGTGASQEDQGPESALAELLSSHKDRNEGGWANGGTAAKSNPLQPMPSEHEMQLTSREITRLLVAGKIKEALQCSRQGHLWAPALVLARQLGERTYVETCADMAQHLFTLGSPLRTLCLLLSGQPKEVFAGLSSPMEVSTLQEDFGQEGYGSMLDDWQENLAVMAANRTDGDERVIIHLGDCLWRSRGEVAAAHMCYMVADAQLEAYSSTARVCLIGADHWKGTRSFVTPEAIQRTEIYEYAKVLGNPQCVLLPFQPYKIVYAAMLAEAGRTHEAQKYCQGVLKLLKNSGRSPEVEACKESAIALSDRLMNHSKGGGSNIQKGIIGGFVKFIDGKLQKFVGGPPTAVPSVNVGGNNEIGVMRANGGSMRDLRIGSSPSVHDPVSAMPKSSDRMPPRSVSEPDIARASRPKSMDGGSAGSESPLSRPAGIMFKSLSGVFRFLVPRIKKEANMGSENQFIYDEKLKTWRFRDDDGSADEPPDLGPPPTVPAVKSMPSTNLPGDTASRQVSPPSDALSAPPGNGPASDSNAPPRAGVLQGSESSAGSGASTGPGIPAVPPTGPNMFSARRGVRSRYVDTFNKGGGATVTPSRGTFTPLPFMPASAGVGGSGGPTFFVPAPVPTGQSDSESKDVLDGGVGSGETFASSSFLTPPVSVGSGLSGSVRPTFFVPAPVPITQADSESRDVVDGRVEGGVVTDQGDEKMSGVGGIGSVQGGRRRPLSQSMGRKSPPLSSSGPASQSSRSSVLPSGSAMLMRSTSSSEVTQGTGLLDESMCHVTTATSAESTSWGGSERDHGRAASWGGGYTAATSPVSEANTYYGDFSSARPNSQCMETYGSCEKPPRGIEGAKSGEQSTRSLLGMGQSGVGLGGKVGGGVSLAELGRERADRRSGGGMSFDDMDEVPF